MRPASARSRSRSATSAQGSPSLRLAATVAELAEVLRGNDVVTDRGVTLETVAADADALAADGVPGADELAELAHLAALGD